MKKTRKGKKAKEPVYPERVFSSHQLAHIDAGLIQRLIPKFSDKARVRGKFKGHSMSDVRGWMQELVRVLVPRGADRKKNYDGNMRHAKRVGLALLTWYVRTHRAKCMDPRRPVADRKISYVRWLEEIGEIQCALFSDAFDPVLYAGQEWENPWGDNPTDGTFR